MINDQKHKKNNYLFSKNNYINNLINKYFNYYKKL